jgi:anti-sigma factor ChrR (cupin superfamily)
VLDGALEDEEGRYAVGSWLRNPAGSQHMPFSLEGCLLYVKIGHLPAVVT